jgi:hypothetical protein
MHSLPSASRSTEVPTHPECCRPNGKSATATRSEIRIDRDGVFTRSIAMRASPGQWCLSAMRRWSANWLKMGLTRKTQAKSITLYLTDSTADRYFDEAQAISWQYDAVRATLPVRRMACKKPGEQIVQRRAPQLPSRLCRGSPVPV